MGTGGRRGATRVTSRTEDGGDAYCRCHEHCEHRPALHRHCFARVTLRTRTGSYLVERKVRLSHCEIFLVQFAPRCTSRFRQVQRGARGAVAVHATARDRNGAPGSALHFKRTERSLVSSVAFAALVYSGLVARSPKSCTCASTELVAYLQITTTAHACRPGCTRVVTQGSSAAALGAFYSAELARYRQFCHVSSCFFPIMQG